MSLDIIKHRQEEMRKLKEQHQLKKQERIIEAQQQLGLHPMANTPEKHFDHPNTMENGTALMLYLLVMAVGAIFNARWIIWILATMKYSAFINRHNKK